MRLKILELPNQLSHDSPDFELKRCSCGWSHLGARRTLAVHAEQISDLDQLGHLGHHGRLDLKFEKMKTELYSGWKHLAICSRWNMMTSHDLMTSYFVISKYLHSIFLPFRPFGSRSNHRTSRPCGILFYSNQIIFVPVQGSTDRSNGHKRKISSFRF